MTLSYGTTSIPSDKYDVVEGGTVQVSAAFERTVAVVGGMDTDNGTATEGNLVNVTDSSDAQSKFGDGSELHEAIKIIYNNGASDVYALPVSETETTENSIGTSGTLSNTPLFDPNIHDEHSIDFVDTGGTDPSTTVTYDDPANLSLSTDEAAVNPITGEYEIDSAASGQYDVTYTYGDYSSSVLQTAADQDTRIVAVLTEAESVVNNLATELDGQDDDFVFQHGVAGATPVIDPTDTSTYTSNYSDGVDDERITLVSSPRGYIDDAETDEHRTISGISGYLSGLPLGLSSTNDTIDGYTALRSDFTPSQASTLIDNQVMPLIDWPPVTIVKDMTTSTTQKFERVYSMQVIDEVTELSHTINREFIGDQNTNSNRKQLDRSLRNMLKGLAEDTPPLLSDYTVSVKQNTSNDNQVDVEIGLEVVGVMDTIDVTITVGDIVDVNVA